MRRLKPYDIVLVAPPAWRSSMRQIACQVVGVDHGQAALEPLERRDIARLPAAIGDVYMTFAHDGNFIALRGDLVLKSALRVGTEGDMADERPDLRFRVTDGVHFPPRDALSLPLCAPVTLTALEGAAPRAQLHTQTISVTGDGMLVEGWDVELGDRVETELVLPGSSKPVPGVAQLVPTGEDGVMLAYEHIGRADRERLVTFIFDCHREALRLHKAEQRLLATASVGR